jgi:uncharacterized protein
MFSILLSVSLLFAQSAPLPRSLVELTRTLIERLLVDTAVSPIVDRFDDRMRAALSAPALQQAVTQMRAQAGTFRAVTSTREETRGGYRLVVVTCQMTDTLIDVSVAWSDAGRIVGVNMRPAAATSAYHAPPYVVTDRFKESEVVVDAGTGWPLAGTLSLPTGQGPFPAVVLVHGSGPNDRDESIGPNRPFRDLAWGLASRGIAVLRYDKRTLVHAARINTVANFTVKDETIDDAAAAAALLRATAGVRADRVFVAGHSLGGMLAPRIGATDPKLAGLVILAGAVRPLEDSIVAQTRYLAEVDGSISESERALIAEAEAMAVRARQMKAGDPPLTGPLASGPASYVNDLRGYHPPTAAKALAQPMLILQGERDYQVTIDDFAAWREALGRRPDVQLTTYPSLNHLFMPGTGKSTPAEYMIESHVAEAVVNDIAAWIKGR